MVLTLGPCLLASGGDRGERGMEGHLPYDRVSWPQEVTEVRGEWRGAYPRTVSPGLRR